MESLREAIEIAHLTTLANLWRLNEAITISESGGDLPEMVESWMPDYLFDHRQLGLANWDRYWDTLNQVSPLFTSSPAASADPKCGPIESTSAWHWAVMLATDELLRLIMRECDTNVAVHWFLGEVGEQHRQAEWPIFRERQAGIRQLILERFSAVRAQQSRIQTMLIKERDSALIKCAEHEAISRMTPSESDRRGRNDPAVRPAVSEDSKVILIDGTPFGITPNQGLYLRELIRRGDWMSDSEFRTACPEVGGNARPERWRANLHDDLKAHLTTDKRRGTRWNDEVV